ncbi:MAG TPA: patatin-like phospholipase family protein [Aldersonia sp.]
MTTDAHDAAAAETATTDADPTKKKEVRYGLVLNGGVSLAVWMGGVTHELNRLRLASEDDDSDSVWREILDHAGRSIAVDLIAGTSAGGLNGAVLATTIARGAEMPDMKKNWRSLASLEVERLTRKNPQGHESLLDGDYLTSQIDSVLDSIEPGNGRAGACTLFLTATALNSKEREYRFRTEPGARLQTGGACTSSSAGIRSTTSHRSIISGTWTPSRLLKLPLVRPQHFRSLSDLSSKPRNCRYTPTRPHPFGPQQFSSTVACSTTRRSSHCCAHSASDRPTDHTNESCFM